MAIPNDYIDKITNKDSGESRIISPAADKVRVDNENFEGTDLDEVLDEVAQAIGESGSGDGTVTGVKVGNTPYGPDGQGVVDLSTPFAGKVDKNGTDSLMTAAEHTKLQNLPTAETLTQQLGDKANDNEVVKSISVNGQAPQTPTQGNVNIQVPSGGLTESDISVETQGDGTFTIRVGSNDYTINLNHTHDGMAKLVVDTAANLPDVSEMESDTIYGEEEDGEISVIYLGGIPFYGGGGGGVSIPLLREPADDSVTVFEAVSGTVRIKGRALTAALTVTLETNTDVAFGSTQPTGVTVVSNTELSISAEAANAGVSIAVEYSGSDYDSECEMEIIGSTDNISVVCSLVFNSTQGAVAYWRGTDLPTNNSWVDYYASLPITLIGNVAHADSGYQFNNLTDQINAKAKFNSAYNSVLNQRISTVFTCFVDCKVKFSASDRRAAIIDFGSFGNSSGGLSINCVLRDDGTLTATSKIGNGNTGFNDRVYTANTGIVFTQNSYTDIRVKIGSRILANGKQELYCECGNGKCYGIIDVPVVWNFAGVDGANGQPNAFVLALGYTDRQYVAELAPKIYADVIYENIVIFNTEK